MILDTLKCQSMTAFERKFFVNNYEKLDNKIIKEEYVELIKQWKQFVSSENVLLRERKDFFVHKSNLFQVIDRTHRRKIYYNIFYGDELCEYKRVAIECFWINTLKPFMVVDEKSKLYHCPNEMFSLYRILAVIRRMYEKKCEEEKIDIREKPFVYPSNERIQDILYDFKYCDVSREAMISFVETFADNYGVGIDYIFRNKQSNNENQQ